jgi:SAM-dependent methyltransferase
MQHQAEKELDAFYRAIAPYYDEDYANLLEGQNFYVELAKESGGPVLEMGCGTGRILIPVARAGVTAYGMDISKPMLDQLSASLQKEPAIVQDRITILHDDIRSADTGRRFPFIFAAGNVLHTFLDRADQRAWLRNVRRHLEPGGAFVFDVFQFDYRYLLIPSDQWNVQVDRTEAATGYRVRRFYRVEHEPELQRFRVEFRWLIEDASGVTVKDERASIMQRWFTKGELENLLELEGFRITHYWGSFEREPFGKGSTEQIIRAVSAAV